MLSEAYDKALVFLPLTLVISLIYTIRKGKVNNDEILDEDINM